MKTAQYGTDFDVVVHDIDQETTFQGNTLSDLLDLDPGRFFKDRAQPEGEYIEYGPYEFCSKVEDNESFPLITIFSDVSSTEALSPLPFVSHPVRRPH